MSPSTGVPSTTSTKINSDREFHLDANILISYGVVMGLILAVGLVGNVLTILVLRCPEHRRKNITPLMINLAVADIIIIVFGYPVVVSSNFASSGLNLRESRPLCIWSGFINGATGIASIANLTMMSLVMFHGVSSVTKTTKISTIKMAAIITFTWAYGVTSMIPPLVGWNEFVPGASGISCCPNWVPETKAGVAYNMFLVFVGFVLPLSVIIFCYYRIYSFIRTQQPTSGNASVEASRRKSQIRMVRTIAMSIAAFVLSWSPYCLVSIIATIRGTNSLTPSEAEVPDLLAKASVIFNPIVYTVMNDRFRATLLRIIPCGSLFSREVNPASNSVSRSVGSIVDNASSSFDKRRSQRYQNDQNDV